MTETYSQAITGIPAEQAFATKPHLTLPDSACQRVTSMHQSMRLGQQILCQNPDGSQSWYTLDSERSTNANPVLRRV